MLEQSEPLELPGQVDSDELAGPGALVVEVAAGAVAVAAVEEREDDMIGVGFFVAAVAEIEEVVDVMRVVRVAVAAFAPAAVESR